MYDQIEQLTAKLKEVFQASEIGQVPDLQEDQNKENVFGYITSDFFEGKTNEEAQVVIWKIIYDNFEESIRKHILYIINETKLQHYSRVCGYIPMGQYEVWKHRIWTHKASDQTIFWCGVDFQKIADDYKTFFFFIQNTEFCSKKECDKPSMALVFNYTKDIIDLMGFEKQEEIYPELFKHAYEQLCGEISMILMDKYDLFCNEQHVWGEKNPFYYVYNNFNLTPVHDERILFSAKEIELIEPIKDSMDKNFELKKILEKVILRSKMFLEANKVQRQ